jgi:hypothetical protein
MANPIRTQLPDIEAEIIPEFVTKRYYLTQRLLKAINIILQYVSATKDSSMQCVEIVEQILWKDDYIQALCSEITHTRKMSPIFELWDYFSQFRKIHDADFNRETCVLIRVCLQCIYAELHRDLATKNSWLADIDSLPLEEILSTIDLLVEQMPAILEKYELQSNLSWKQWFKKYWWAVPVISTVIGLRILVAYKDIMKLIGKTS